MKKETKPKQNLQPKVSPLDIFFKLGDKVTRGNPKRKMDFDYYMLWIIFLAFFMIFVGNLRSFALTFKFAYLGWSLFGLAIMWFQYHNLKTFYNVRKQMNASPVPVKSAPPTEKIESVKEMLSGFEKFKQSVKGGK